MSSASPCKRLLNDTLETLFQSAGSALIPLSDLTALLDCAQATQAILAQLQPLNLQVWEQNYLSSISMISIFPTADQSARNQPTAHSTVGALCSGPFSVSCCSCFRRTSSTFYIKPTTRDLFTSQAHQTPQGPRAGGAQSCR
jgi:hypothetical protein